MTGEGGNLTFKPRQSAARPAREDTRAGALGYNPNATPTLPPVEPLAVEPAKPPER